MKNLILAVALCTAAANVTLAQKVQTHEEHYKLKKKSKNQTLDTLRKDTAPILNDNGSTNTTGTIEGRSSTGRTGSDTITTYTRRKRTIRTSPDTLKK